MTTLFDLIDKWTLDSWDRGKIESTLEQVASPFYDRKKVLLILDDFWDLLEIIDDPYEFMTEDTKKQQVELYLSDEFTERCAKSINLEVVSEPELQIRVLNADEIVNQHPVWFDEYDPMTWDEVESTIKRALDEK